jgi:flagellar protein FliO/FliZ
MSSWLPLFWFLAILALIPLALWLLKRSPVMATGMPGGSRVIASQYLGPGQRLLTVEVGEGEQRRWLLLGATAHHISLLGEQHPQVLAETPRAGFAALLHRGRP